MNGTVFFGDFFFGAFFFFFFLPASGRKDTAGSMSLSCTESYMA